MKNIIVVAIVIISSHCNCYGNRIQEGVCDGIYSFSTLDLGYQINDKGAEGVQREVDSMLWTSPHQVNIRIWRWDNTIVKETLEIGLKFAQPYIQGVIYYPAGHIVKQTRITSPNSRLPESYVYLGAYDTKLSNAYVKA